MANIDVADLLVDPDFCDAMTLITRVPTVNAFGENSLVDTAVVSVGSIQPASGQTVNRVPEALRVVNLTSFWFKGTITASAPGAYSDILVFKGKRFQVKQVFDWTNYGQGWCEGVCVAEVIAP